MMGIRSYILPIAIWFLAGCAAPDPVADRDTGILPTPSSSDAAGYWPFEQGERPLPPGPDVPGALVALRDIVSSSFVLPVSWQRQLQGFDTLKPVEQAMVVSSLVNEAPYRNEPLDVWRHPSILLAEGGDCDCHAIAKYALLRHFGYDAESLRLTIVRRPGRTTLHMVLIARTGSGADRQLILDSATDEVRSVKYTDYYRPVLSLNENGVWLHDDLTTYQINRLINPVYKDKPAP